MKTQKVLPNDLAFGQKFKFDT